jgi:hypothetical protein
VFKEGGVGYALLLAARIEAADPDLGSGSGCGFYLVALP